MMSQNNFTILQGEILLFLSEQLNMWEQYERAEYKWSKIDWLHYSVIPKL